jgi:hypothetical protein
MFRQGFLDTGFIGLFHCLAEYSMMEVRDLVTYSGMPAYINREKAPISSMVLITRGYSRVGERVLFAQ